MKKLVLLFAVAAMTVSASAQSTVYGSKFTDNWYVGVQGGLATKTTQNRWLSNTNPFAGIRLGKDFTPAFGLVAEGNVYFNDRSSVGTVDFGQDGKYIAGHDRDLRTKTFAKSLNVNLLAKVNLTNAIAGYTGEPRAFEVSALYGFGWLHGFGDYEYWGGTPDVAIDLDGRQPDFEIKNHALNRLTSKAALNFAFNFGADKQFQAFVEPSINFYDLNDFKYNLDNSMVQLTAGVVYKFNNSWGTHNFKLAELRDQAEIDALNAQINELRNRKPEVITKEVIKEVPVGKEVRVEDLVFVTFAQAKYNLTKEAKEALDKVAEGSHVQIVGTASPEGNAQKNLVLSQNRANAVKDYLQGRGVIVDEAVGKGVQGTTSNRLAIVYVK
ncbi:MAG: OmpA family protein [Prevotella sp.]|nr:OmpA family protein [Prevotella sp.]